MSSYEVPPAAVGNDSLSLLSELAGEREGGREGGTEKVREKIAIESVESFSHAEIRGYITNDSFFTRIIRHISYKRRQQLKNMQ